MSLRYCCVSHWLGGAALPALLLLQGCMPRSVLVHDGLETTVIDALTQQPLAGVVIASGGQYLTQSDAQGQVRVAPQRTLKLEPLMGEANVMLNLLACKDGYAPQAVALRGGWNADYGPSQVHREVIRMQRALEPSSYPCPAALK